MMQTVHIKLRQAHFTTWIQKTDTEYSRAANYLCHEAFRSRLCSRHRFLIVLCPTHKQCIRQPKVYGTVWAEASRTSMNIGSGGRNHSASRVRLRLALQADDGQTWANLGMILLTARSLGQDISTW